MSDVLSEKDNVAPKISSLASLSSRDFLFALVNGALIGILAPFVFRNLGAILPIPHWIFVIDIILLCVIGIAIGYFLAKITRHLGFFQLAKFGLTGTGNTIIDLGIFSLIVWVSGIETGFIIFFLKAVSGAIAITNSYLWNKFWSFEEKTISQDAIRKQFLQFIAVSLSALAVNAGVTTLVATFGNVAGLDPKAWATISGAIGSVFVLAWNFVGYKFFVFKR